MNDNNEFCEKDDYLVPCENEAFEKGSRDMMRQVFDPFLAALQTVLDHNCEEYAQIAAAINIQTAKIDALEKQIRLSTPVTPIQVKYINGEIRRRSRELLSRWESGYEDDSKAVDAMGRLIRKAVLVRYGISALNELPRCEYSVVIGQISLYNNNLAIRDIAKEAEKHAEEKASCTSA